MLYFYFVKSIMVTVKHRHRIGERPGRYESNQYETCYLITKTQERYRHRVWRSRALSEIVHWYIEQTILNVL
jgi:hypothetical protein